MEPFLLSSVVFRLCSCLFFNFDLPDPSGKVKQQIPLLTFQNTFGKLFLQCIPQKVFLNRYAANEQLMKDGKDIWKQGLWCRFYSTHKNKIHSAFKELKEKNQTKLNPSQPPTPPKTPQKTNRKPQGPWAIAFLLHEVLRESRIT